MTKYLTVLKLKGDKEEAKEPDYDEDKDST
jgi:hypothetical protein